MSLSYVWVPWVVSGLVAFGILRALIPALRRAGLTGRDMNKPDRPEVPEMGGLGLVGGFGCGVLVVLALQTFTRWGEDLGPPVDPVALFAVLSVVLLIALIGVVDDLLGVSQRWKALIPAVGALPLMVIEAGQTAMKIPLIGQVDFGVFYALVLIPLGITGAANAVNMLAGFNGLEAGMGAVAMASLAIIAYTLEATTALVILVAALGALLATLAFNWYPARVFVGDVGTLSIGAILASAVIVGNFEAAGVLLIVPYACDFVLKALSGFPSEGWWGELGEDGKLRCPAHRRPVGLCQLLMKLTGGIRERDLVLVLMGIEALFGLIAIGLYAKF